MRYRHLVFLMLCLWGVSCQSLAPQLEMGSIKVDFMQPGGTASVSKMADELSTVQISLRQNGEQVFNKVYSSDGGFFRVLIQDIEPDTAYHLLVKGWIGDPEPRARAEVYGIVVSPGRETRLSLTWSAFFPTLLSPVSGGDVFASDGPPVLSWSRVEGAVSYHLQVSTKRDIVDSTSVINSEALKVTQFQTDSLEPGFTYYWQVRCVDAENAVGEWSKKAGFRFQE